MTNTPTFLKGYYLSVIVQVLTTSHDYGYFKWHSSTNLDIS